MTGCGVNIEGFLRLESDSKISHLNILLHFFLFTLFYQTLEGA